MAALRGDGSAVSTSTGPIRSPRLHQGVARPRPRRALHAPPGCGCRRRRPQAASGSLPLVPRPDKIICVGLNYADHARESGMRLRPEPVIFTKFPTASSRHGEPIVLPQLSQRGRLRGRAGRRHRPRRAAHPAETGAGARRRLLLRQRRLGPRLADATSRAASGCWASRSTPSPPSARHWSPPTRCPTRQAWRSSSASTASVMQDSSTGAAHLRASTSWSPTSRRSARSRRAT